MGYEVDFQKVKSNRKVAIFLEEKTSHLEDGPRLRIHG